MGTLYYGGSDETPIHMEDRALAHLKPVIATKLRRGESFTLSWRHPEGVARGRSTIWLHPSIPLRFVFDDPESPELNPQWIKDLALSANSSGGIMLIAEQITSAPVDLPLSTGKLTLAELNVDTLMVAGAQLAPGAAGLDGGTSEDGF